MSRPRIETVKIGPLARWVKKTDPQTGEVVYVEKLKPKGQRVLAEFMATYNPVVKLYATKKRKQYWALRREGVSNDEINALCEAGAVIAATKFDPRRGFEFGSYALYWMWAECSRELERVRQGKSFGVFTTSLTDVSPAGNSEFGDWEPADDTEHSAAERDEATHARITIHRVMFSVLTEREREVIRSRVGMGWQQPASLEDTGVRCGLGVSKERVRQIESGAMQKMREALGVKELTEAVA